MKRIISLVREFLMGTEENENDPETAKHYGYSVEFNHEGELVSLVVFDGRISNPSTGVSYDTAEGGHCTLVEFYDGKMFYMNDMTQNNLTPDRLRLCAKIIEQIARYNS